MRTLHALPALFRVGLASAFAYRAELLVWMLSTTMPLIMLPLWHAVAEEAPVQGFGQARFTAYFLAGFVVRQMVGAWAAWSINYEVRSGALNQRLMRPISPLLFYATENLASIPLRAVVALPVAFVAFLVTSGEHVARGPVLWATLPFALAGAWAITFFAHVIIGSFSLWMHQSIRMVDVWMAGFFVFSGYLVPVELFPPIARELPHWLPFVYQLGYPVNLLTGAMSEEEALRALAAQWSWVAVLAALAAVAWRRGLARYGAYGG